MPTTTNWNRMTTVERRDEMHRRMGARPLIGNPMTEAIFAEVWALVGEGCDGGPMMVDAVTQRLGLDGWLSRSSIAERVERAFTEAR